MSQKDIQKPKISGFLTGSILSLWLSHHVYRKCCESDGWKTTTDEWIYYFSPAGCCFYCQHLVPSHLYSHCLFSYCCMNAAPRLPPPSSLLSSRPLSNPVSLNNPSPPFPLPVSLPSSLTLLPPSLPASQYIVLSSPPHSKPSASLYSVL